MNAPPTPPAWLETPAVRAFAGALVADALAMPVHWYYDRAALDRDYGPVTGYLAPRDHHPDSILWRSRYDCTAPEGEILHDRRRFWGQAGVHYHRGLEAGENTLNALLALELAGLVRRNRHWAAERWLEHYVAFMRRPDSHRDTYVEEYHRDFFTNLAAGRKPINCGVRDIHIGGLVPVPALAAALGAAHPDLRRVVGEHVGLTHKDRDVLAAADAFVRMLVRLTREDREPEDLRTVILEEGRDWISEAKVRAWERACTTGPAICPARAVVGGILSPACYIPDAFPAALFLAWRHAGDVGAGALANARCGGDNCHRGAVVGSLLGATAATPRPLLEGLRSVDTIAGS